MISRLHKHYRAKAIPALRQQFNFPNVMAIPTVEKIVLNVGFGKNIKDNQAQTTAMSTLERITGQHPVTTKAKKSISAFKLREGAVIGTKVTLRGERMWEFLDKLINVTLPRVRDFHGISPKSLGQSGTLTLGFREHIVFPEIRSDEIEHLHGLEVSIVTTAKNKDHAFALLTQLGFPFTPNE